MPTPQMIRVLPAAGSINTGAPGHLLADNEYQDLLNYYSWAGKLRRRGGSLRLTAEAYHDKITKLYPVRDSTGVWHMVIGGSQSLGIMGAPAYIPTVPTDPYGLPASDEPWGFAARDDVVYAYRSDLNKGRRLNMVSGALTYAGIDPPSIAPTIADGAAGNIPAANFYGVYDYINLVTGNHSAYSPVSTVLAHAGSKKIAWTWTASTNGQVTHARLYRTLPDQTGAYYLVATVPVGLLSYEEDTLVDGMGKAAISGVGSPLSTWRFPTVFHERLWVTDGRFIFPSQLLLYETFDPRYGLPVGPDDGSRIIGMVSDDDRLYIQKENGTYYLTGDGPSSWTVHELDPRHGGLSHHALGIRKGTLIWPGFDALYTSTGGPGEPVKNGVHTRELFRAMDLEQRKNFQAVVDDRDDLYILVPRYPNVTDTATNEGPWARRVLVYSYQTGDVSTFRLDRLGETDFDWVEIAALAYGIQPNGQPGLWMAVERMDSDPIYAPLYDILTFNDLNWNWDDIGHPLNCFSGGPLCGTYHQSIRTKWTTRDFGGEAASLRGILRFWLMASRNPSPGAVLTATPRDGGGTPLVRIIDLLADRLWQAYSLPRRQTPPNTVSVTLETAALLPTDIDGFAVEATEIRRPRSAR